jgi:hypothetical protein
MNPTLGHVLVTGASAGLGAAFARGYAAQGRALVLVARREERLVELARELSAAHGVEVQHVALDLSQPDAAARLEAWCDERGLAIDVLVNNAGAGAQGAFVALDRARQLELLALNVVAATDLAHRFASRMAQRGRGGVINLASTAGFMPGPGMAVYYASKAYVLSLSEALTSEFAPRGVRVTALCPGPTETEFRVAAGRPRSRVLDSVAMQPEPVVAAGMRALERGRAVCVPGLFNKLCCVSVRFLPRAFVRALVARIQMGEASTSAR